MISISEALEQLFDLVTEMPVETVPLAQAAGRVLARDVTATRSQPPFAASAMDGYAVRAEDLAKGAKFTVIGESAAGHGFGGDVRQGEAVRIFTGAPLPEGASFVIIQEDVSRISTQITVTGDTGSNSNIRPAGVDFREGDSMTAPRVLRAADQALLASMNVAQVPVFKRPDVALISTGDELVMPGETPGQDQIIASNTFGLKAMLDAAGAHTRILPIAGDNAPALEMAFDLASGADLMVTIGGASVGDHDIVAPVAQSLGMEQSFYKVAMRPGKPLMAGRMGKMAMIGLPGNPVSAMVCGQIFLVPVLRAMLGLGRAPCPRLTAELSAPLPANGPREHYMRAQADNGRVQPFDNQDSSLLSVLSQSNALLVCPPDMPARGPGDRVEYIPLD